GVGEVSGRRAGDGLEPELSRLGQGDRDDAVLERVRRVRGVVLDPDLGQAGRERIAGSLGKGQEVRVTPDPGWSSLDLALRLRRVERRVVVGDLERSEALLADVEGLERVVRPTLLATERLRCHLKLLPAFVRLRKRPLRLRAEVRTGLPL